MSMNPRNTTEKIRSDYREYIESILSVRDPELRRLVRENVRRTEFVKGPYLETTLPFEDGKTLRELAEEGVVSREFAVMGESVHYDEWKLRIHQEQALRKVISERRNVVVSTSTGSGKTECYLYPIFDALMREKEAGKLGPGVRALLIFPMNALANDQQKKLRKLLRTYPDITFGRYTGETQHKRRDETPQAAEKRLHKEYDDAHSGENDPALRRSIPNELMCREMMTENPPHLLLTNYAMLEYMLLRPDTAPFFDNESAQNWRFFVIDEAHTYKGANGTEIAYLLRRVKERISHRMTGRIQCIATSATLGSGDGAGKLAEFASKLFGEPFTASDVITTKRKSRVRPADGRAFLPEDYRALRERTDGLEENQKSRALYQVLEKDLRLFAVYDALKDKPQKLSDVAERVFPELKTFSEKENALIDLIELAAAAKKNSDEAALLPARYHLFVKSLEGMFAQLYPRKAVFLDRRERVQDGEALYPVFELADCQKCGQAYLVGKMDVRDSKRYFLQTSSMEKTEYLFISDREDESLSDFDEDDSTEEAGKLNELEKYHLCLSCGRITEFAEKHPMDCCANSDAKKITTVFRLKYTGKETEHNCCPCCGATGKGMVKRFLTANQPATFAVAKSLYDALPPRPPVTENPSHPAEDDLFTDDLFDDDLFDESSAEGGPEGSILDESGRKLLVFSDNRQEAAFFAGFFEKKYNQNMWRKVIVQCLAEAKDNRLRMDDLIRRVMNYADRCGLYSYDLEKRARMTDDQKQAIAERYVMQEFISPDNRTGLEHLGYLSIEPEPLKLRPDAVRADFSGEKLWNLLRYMMDTLRQKGAVSFPELVRPTDDFFAPRNHAGYFRESGSKAVQDGYVYGFIPAAGAKNKRLGVMLKALRTESGTPEEKDEKARENLKLIYDLLLSLQKKGYITLAPQEKGEGVCYHLNHAKWYFRLLRAEDTLYRCKQCGKVFSYAFGDQCPEMKCEGELETVAAGELQTAPYYGGLYADSKLIPMTAREHTAQLSSQTAGEYQKDFEDGKINVLSCSTTFEMGVDVGELEATFQRNVPPETSNYIQRAGRAGRRTSSAAFSVTFARRSSHDMTFFQDPAQIIAGKIAAPFLETENEKIAERHLNSIVVGWFFRQRQEFFTENARRIVSYQDGDTMAAALRKCLEDRPEELLESIHSVFSERLCAALKTDEWGFIDSLTGPEGSLTRAIEGRTADILNLRQFREDALKQEYGAQRAASAEKLIKTLETEPSINFLSANGVLPKYGFPVDSVSLDILSSSIDEAKRIDLSRDLKMAISEFAPPAQIVANGKVWRSYAINTVPDKGWPAYAYYECPKCKTIAPPDGGMIDANSDVKDIPQKLCRCGNLMNPKKFIIPIFGFSTKMGEKPSMVGDNRPSTYYVTQTQFWGINDLTERERAETRETTCQIGEKEVEITYSPGGKLFVLNQGRNGVGLQICPRCGYTDDPTMSRKKKKHETRYGNPCGSHSMIFASLGHTFSTDVMQIRLPAFDVNIPDMSGGTQKDQYLSVLYAILEGASYALEITRDDISGCVTEEGKLVLYDNNAGGAGFVKHIYENFEKVLRAAKYKVSGQCGCAEEVSCYGCLRNYANQYFHDMISRGLAYRYLEWLLGAEN